MALSTLPDHLGTLAHNSVIASFHGGLSFTLFSNTTPLQAQALHYIGGDPASVQ